MRHSTERANSLIKVSALIIAGIYVYRRLTETFSGDEAKVDPNLAPLGRFVVGFAFTFFVLSVLAGPSPTLAGNMALLILIASILANGVPISKDIQEGLRRPSEERQQLLHPKGSKGRAHPGAAGGTGIPETRKV